MSKGETIWAGLLGAFAAIFGFLFFATAVYKHDMGIATGAIISSFLGAWLFSLAIRE